MISTETPVRHARPEELDALLDLYAHLQDVDAPLSPTRDLHAFWERIVANPMLHYLVAEVDGRLAASCMLAIIPNLARLERPYGLIENVVTHPDYRRRGLGTAVLRHAMDLAWDANCYKVTLLTGSEEPGVHEFYCRAGFQKHLRTGFATDAP